MAITDDLRKTLTDATPLYALAGTADLAAEKLGEVPALVEKVRIEAPKRFESVRATDPKEIQDRVTKQAKDAQGKFNELLGSLDGDLKKLREQAQDLAMQSVGRAAEYAVKARETYDELAERGRGAVQTWRGETADQVEDLAVAIEPEAKQPTVKESLTAQQKAKPANGTKTEARPAAEKKTTPAAKPAAKKTTPPAK
ncbi:hypothetical protein [Streptomyces sp. NPDC017993]|uniref:hypothetical protein n=1 Tax=Streptomyces sp. NPDC017993 TaxID=3365027 RepID=UPI003798483B